MKEPYKWDRYMYFAEMTRVIKQSFIYYTNMYLIYVGNKYLAYILQYLHIS